MAENQNIEWKESWRDDYLKWICGFANAQGGKIYIGIDDNGNVTGITNSRKLLDDIPNKVRDVLGILVDVNLHAEGGRDYVEIVVNPNPYPISYHGEYHYRTGSTKQVLVGQALNQFLLEKTGITWDSIPVPNVSVDELRNDSFEIFRDQAVLSGRMTSQDMKYSNEQLLDSLNLLDNGLLKRAAILLFHHNPEKWISGAYVKIGYFSSDSDLRYQDEIHGSLLSQATQVVDLIYTKYLKADIGYQGVTRVETYPFPRKAIREAIFNALAHKYYGTLIPIQIRVYDNKILIANDCIFPSDWTIADLLGSHRSRPYNPLIANTFFRAGFIEAWGRGIETIKESCAQAGNPLPEYTVKPTEIMVLFQTLSSPGQQVLVSESMSESVSELMSRLEYDRFTIIKEYLKTHETITTASAAKLLEVQDKTAQRLLTKAEKLRILSGEGKTKDKVYRNSTMPPGK